MPFIQNVLARSRREVYRQAEEVEMLTRDEIAMHILAQLTRFVVRKQMTEEDAAKQALSLANAFLKERAIQEPELLMKSES